MLLAIESAITQRLQTALAPLPVDATAAHALAAVSLGNPRVLSRAGTGSY